VDPEPRERHQRTAQEGCVHQHQVVGQAMVAPQERDAREDLQQEAKGARDRALLAQAHPEHRGALERPARGGPARVECERDRECAEDHAESEERLREQRPALAARGE
jgi:hypothetical protein